ncbi:MAG: serine acetyltransferase [Prevotellaceae bacterium]|jgi:serine O-acetyltransferase|nr:serine acetyltransferase [Prevotellaceae bacterium]
MQQKNRDLLNQSISQLVQRETHGIIYHSCNETSPLPSVHELEEVVTITRAIVFPGYFGNSEVNSENLALHIEQHVKRLFNLLEKQIYAGLCFDPADNYQTKLERAQRLAAEFITCLPQLRELLTTDVIAAYNGDPAAKSYAEVILCYPAIRAISNYRMAHELLHLGVPLIPRIITEMAHSETGIDIHPGARIGAYFTIDHGTGVVIGETAVIGKNVKLYQGVTLGAKSFPLDRDGNPIKGINRHPIIEDDVIIYSNASILGRITVGRGSVIGGNVWIDNDLPAGSKVLQKK